MKKKKRRNLSEINAGSMADIAFLMLIFFLVATTIAADKGILVKLPPWEDEPISQPVKDRNVLSVHVNFEGDLLVEDELTPMEDLRELVKEHVANPMKKENFSEKPTKAVVSLVNDRNTSYTSYISIYYERNADYRELWEMEALKTHQKPFADLSVTVQKEIRNVYPQIISEAEPTDFKKE